MTDIHLMLDLETLGNSHDAAIIQIGACIFDKTAMIEEFSINIDFDDALKYGTVTGNTIHWWMQQDDEAIKGVSETRGNDSLKNGLLSFRYFCQENKPDHFWAHATFDFPIIENAYKRLDIETPIHYRKCGDLRTAEFLLPDIEWPKREGVYHDARDDAIYQAKCLQMMWEEKIK